jgi:Lon protease-like protein
MRRDLPPRPHIDHLKKQAKDLLEAHKRAEAPALARIRDVLPAFAGRSDAEVASAAFALHDAQSAIAREYGFPSWRQLRTAILARVVDSYSAENLRAVWQQVAPPGVAALSDSVFEAIRTAHSERDALADSLARAELPQRLPLLATRNALLLPGSLAPFRVARPRTLAAVHEAKNLSPRLLGVFAQRSETDEHVSFEGLHPIGCCALLHADVPEPGGPEVTIVIQALRPIVLESVETSSDPNAPLFARVRPFEVDDSRDTDELAALDQSLRELALQLTAALPDPQRARLILDAADEDALANLVVANLPYSVAEKAAFAAEPVLAERLRLAKQMIDRFAEPPPR